MASADRVTRVYAFDTVAAALSAEACCDPSDLRTEGVHLSELSPDRATNPLRRRYPIRSEDLHIVTMGKGVVVSATPGWIPWVTEMFCNLEPDEAFSPRVLGEVSRRVSCQAFRLHGPYPYNVTSSQDWRDREAPYGYAVEVGGAELSEQLNPAFWPNVVSPRATAQGRPNVVTAVTIRKREGGRRGRRQHRLGRPLANRDRRAVGAQRQRSGCRPDLAGSKRLPCSRQGALLRLQGRQHRLAAHGALGGVLSQLGRRIHDGRVGAVSLRLRIRPVEQEDIGGLIAALAPGVGEAQMRMRFEESLDGYREILVAELDGYPVGTVSTGGHGFQRPGSLRLFALDVGEAFRGKGVGTALVNAVEAAAARPGSSRGQPRGRDRERGRGPAVPALGIQTSW